MRVVMPDLVHKLTGEPERTIEYVMNAIVKAEEAVIIKAVMEEGALQERMKIIHLLEEDNPHAAKTIKKFYKIEG